MQTEIPVAPALDDSYEPHLAKTGLFSICGLRSSKPDKTGQKLPGQLVSPPNPV
ncbi:hypothetical protein DPMN_038256 [Dreissena polymorpha]|uniref:Uncharacterized protein n=1 Tax=Dreissena polymorpha TaxID=45954 RepID=A0A9D4MDY1_DREPO|nr:hypothetical protein DPMN_038256 [Dreissena polymorpha]